MWCGSDSEAAGKEPGEIVIGGIDLSPKTIEGINSGYISASFDQVLYLQGYFPVQQIWLMANYQLLASGTVRLISGIVELGEERAGA